MTSNITVSPGISVPIGMGSASVGDGGKFASGRPIDKVITSAAQLLADHFDHGVTVRYNSDGKSGGAWIATHRIDRIGANTEIGITASQIGSADIAWVGSHLSSRAMVDPSAAEGRYAPGTDTRVFDTVGQAFQHIAAHGKLPEIPPWESDGTTQQTWKFQQLLPTLVGERVRVTYTAYWGDTTIAGDLEAADDSWTIGSKRLNSDGFISGYERVAKLEVKQGARYVHRELSSETV